MSRKILVIDDEELITKSLLRLLSAREYSVTVARSGTEAVKKVKDADFDLVVSDVRMPGLDGLDTIREIREHFRSLNKQSPPEIIITGYADIGYADIGKHREARGMRIAEYLHKPFDNDEFLQAVQRSLTK